MQPLKLSPEIHLDTGTHTKPEKTMTVSTPISKETELTIMQELRALQFVKSNLDEAIKALGSKTRFWELAYMLDEALKKADREIIGADDRLTERS
jgi:hypothetical protein